MKEKILQLRSEGKSFREIQKILKCSSATISYHCSPNGVRKKLDSNSALRKKLMVKLKTSFGGKCKLCNYSKSFNALHFHHPNQDKENNVASLRYSWRQMSEEAKKCILVCANCHAELHDMILNGGLPPTCTETNSRSKRV